MRFKLLLLLPLFGAALMAGDISIKQLNLPMFDEAGQLTRTLKAETANGPIERLVLKSGVIEFHAAIGEKIAPGSTLKFDEAIYDKSADFVEGSGSIRFSSLESDLSGVGFHYEIKTGRLKLHRDVLLEPKGEKYKDVKIHGETADVLIRQNPADHSWAVAEALVSGPVVAKDVTIQKVRFDKAETAHVTYSGADGTITFASPVTAWRNGEKTILGGDLIQYQLDAAPQTASP